MTKILVTSGAGLTGSHVVDLFLECRFEVVILGDLSIECASNPNPHAKFYQMDRCNPEFCKVFKKERVV